MFLRNPPIGFHLVFSYGECLNNAWCQTLASIVKCKWAVWKHNWISNPSVSTLVRKGCIARRFSSVRSGSYYERAKSFIDIKLVAIFLTSPHKILLFYLNENHRTWFLLHRPTDSDIVTDILCAFSSCISHDTARGRVVHDGICITRWLVLKNGSCGRRIYDSCCMY